MTEEHLALLRDKVEAWSRNAVGGSVDFRDYNRRSVEALKALLAEWEVNDAQPYKDALHDLVMCRSEQRAIGGGPGWKDRDTKAWRAAEELFEP